MEESSGHCKRVKDHRVTAPASYLGAYAQGAPGSSFYSIHEDWPLTPLPLSHYLVNNLDFDNKSTQANQEPQVAALSKVTTVFMIPQGRHQCSQGGAGLCSICLHPGWAGQLRLSLPSSSGILPSLASYSYGRNQTSCVTFRDKLCPQSPPSSW